MKQTLSARSLYFPERHLPDPVSAWWNAASGEDVPGPLAAAGIRKLERLDRTTIEPLLVFSPVDAERLGTCISEVCQAIGSAAWLVAVPDHHLPRPWVARALELGANDVLDLTQAASIPICLARAKQAFHASQAASAHLAKDRDYLQNAIDNLPSPIFYKNRAGIYVGCNKAFERYIGLDRSEIIGASVYDIAPIRLAEIYDEADDKLMREGTVQVYEADVRYADGTLHTVSFHKAAIRNGAGDVIGLAGAMLDITDRKSLEAQLTRAAERDPLTNCYNRRKFFEVAGKLADKARTTGKPICVGIADIDFFKSVNDRLGHLGGDAVLREVAARLERTSGPGNLMARTGGEEFCFVYPDCAPERFQQESEALRAAVEVADIEFEGTSVCPTISLGTSAFDPKTESLNDALARADRALYAAKEAGRNRVCFAR